MDSWRLIIENSVSDSFMKMAIDEAILNEIGSGKSMPTLRFYKWNKPAVAVGYFQSIKKEVNIEACKKDNIEIFRRMTGGGAVYKDPKGELNYSLIIPESKTSADILESYKHICSGIISGLSILGIKSEFRGINDIVINDKKISGNAQTRSFGAVLQHGTILLNFDPEMMVKYLNICPEKYADKFIKNAKQRVGTIKALFPELTESELLEAVIKGFSTIFNVEFAEEKLTEEETRQAKKLFNKKYSTKEWNYWK